MVTRISSLPSRPAQPSQDFSRMKIRNAFRSLARSASVKKELVEEQVRVDVGLPCRWERLGKRFPPALRGRKHGMRLGGEPIPRLRRRGQAASLMRTDGLTALQVGYAFGVTPVVSTNLRRCRGMLARPGEDGPGARCGHAAGSVRRLR